MDVDFAPAPIGFQHEYGMGGGTAFKKGLDAEQAARALAKTPLASMANPYLFDAHYRPVYDNGRSDWEAFSHLVPMYQDTCRTQVRMQGAQTGKTCESFMRSLWLMLKFWGVILGFYFPDAPTAYRNSSMRFAPLLRSIAALRPYIGAGPDGAAAVERRTLGLSSILFLTTRGVSSTESLPMRVVFLDEIRNMLKLDIQKVEERQSSFDQPWLCKTSTAGWPNADIHAAFLAGDQRYFHTECACPNGVALSEVFPDCIVDLEGATPELRRKVEHACTMASLPYCGVSEEVLAERGAGMLHCPRCGTWITHPRAGWWEPHNPGAYIHSWQVSQMLAPSYNGPRLAQKIWRPTGEQDIGEAYRSCAGLPYIDTENLPITDDRLRACVVSDLRWAATQSVDWRRKWIRNSVMGIDHMGGYNCVVIKQIAPNGKHRDVHLEVASGDNPWLRCARLIVEYDVSVCVLEGLPNYNEAVRFAAAFPGRVYILTYGTKKHSAEEKMLRWHVGGKDQKGEETGYKFSVIANKTRIMRWSADRWKMRLNETPDPQGLIQQLPRIAGRVKLTPRLRVGRMEPTAIAKDVYWEHLKACAFEKDYASDEDQLLGRYRMNFRPVGLDPHFAMAGMMADCAAARLRNAMPTDYTQPGHRGEGEEGDLSPDEIRRILRGSL